MVWSHDIEVTPTEIREAWGAIMRGENPFSPRQAASMTVRLLDDYRSPVANDWIGATGAEIDRRLNHGYDVETKDLQIGGAADYSVPMVELSEETGDLLIDQVLSGEDLYRAQWEDVTVPRSLTIRACIGMHAGTDASVLGAYMEWVLKVVDAAQRRGFVPSVELWVGISGPFSGAGSRETLRIRIPLVNGGEVIDVTSWRAYLTPGAFRSLGFVAFALAADKTVTKRRLTLGMGAPTNRGWAVTRDGDVLDIECPGGARSFPEAELDQKLAEAGIE